MIEVRSISKSFELRKSKGNADLAVDPREDGKMFHALKDINFSAPEGKIVGLLGSNGAGKTTLLRILATSLKPTAGTASINGYDVVKNAQEVRRTVGFLSGNTGLYGRLSPNEILQFFGKMYGVPKSMLKSRIANLFESLDISYYADRRCDLLSTGMKQRVSIARSLVHEPEVIIFDEPTTGLDVESAKGILTFIERCKSEGRSIIFSTHHMHEVERLCDSIVIIYQGRICFDGQISEMYQQSGHARLDDAYLALSSGSKSEAAGDSSRG